MATTLGYSNLDILIDKAHNAGGILAVDEMIAVYLAAALEDAEEESLLSTTEKRRIAARAKTQRTSRPKLYTF